MTERTTHPTALPAVVTAFLDAEASSSPRAIAELFNEHAVVVDDGRRHHGREEIARWRSEVAQVFSYTKTMVSAEQAQDVVEITERVEGDFPGGRVDLRSSFVMDEAGLIASLTIAVPE